MGWSGDASGTGSATSVTMDSNKSVIATFDLSGGSGGSITGTWVGTWTTHFSNFGDTTYSVTWQLTQNGQSVSGTYIRVVQTDPVDPPGTTYTGNLVDGVLSGNTLTIFEDGGFEFVGTFTGTTFNGTGNNGSVTTPISLTKQ